MPRSYSYSGLEAEKKTPFIRFICFHYFAALEIVQTLNLAVWIAFGKKGEISNKFHVKVKSAPKCFQLLGSDTKCLFVRKH